MREVLEIGPPCAVPDRLQQARGGALGASAWEVSAEVWRAVGGDAAVLAQLDLAGDERVYPTHFRVGAAAAACTGAAALAAAQCWRARTGWPQRVSLHFTDAALGYRSEVYQRLNGRPVASPRPFQAYFQDKNGRFVQLHMVYPHLREAILQVLAVADEPQAVARAVRQRDGFELETELAALGLPGFALRMADEWQTHAQARALAALPLMDIDAYPGERVELGAQIEVDGGAARRPLDGVRVLDLTRVIAGPVCGRTLASYGAEVMRVHPPHLTEVQDGGRGKRCTNLDLRLEADRRAFERLLDGADVLVQGFRPGGLAELGYGPAQVRERWPSLIYASLSAWGHTGPWADRHGFDSLVQTATGIAAEGAQRAASTVPHPLPCQALDHSTGYLAAAAVMISLARRAQEGGGALIRLSLAQTGRWFSSLGRIEPGVEPAEDEVGERRQTMTTLFGELSSMGPGARLSHTPARWVLPPVPLGYDAPRWQ